MISIQLIKEVPSNSWWVEMMKMFSYLNLGKKFLIHCWNEEAYLSDLVLCYGEKEKTSWEYGVIISGEITNEFITFLNDISLKKWGKCNQDEQKMTPFFNVILGEAFFSSHYGQEVQIYCEGEQSKAVQNIIFPLLEKGLISKYQN